MLRAIGWLIKSALFAAVVLILGNLVRVEGKTVSDQVKTGLAQAERSVPIQNWSEKISEKIGPRRTTKSGAQPKRLSREPSESISASERNKLRSLIEDLNQ